LLFSLQIEASMAAKLMTTVVSRAVSPPPAHLTHALLAGKRFKPHSPS
jgi:hypothetical protein